MQAGPLAPCTGPDFASQQEQFNCVTADPGGAVIVTNGWVVDPATANVPPAIQIVNQYQTTLEAVLDGGAVAFQQTFNAPFSDPSVQNAILQADSLLASGGDSFGAPALTSTTLQSSVSSFSPTLDPSAIRACYLAGPLTPFPTLAGGTFNCMGVTVTFIGYDSSFGLATTSTFGPVTIMTGAQDSDEFDVLPGQLDINSNLYYTYTTNPVTTNTYLTSQSYEINGTAAATVSAVPKPATFFLTSLALGLIVLMIAAKS